MYLSVAKRQAEAIPKEETARMRPWFLNWEIYPILFIAGFLRFYHIDTGNFEGDQGLLWRMAYDAVHHGLLPITASTASLGFANAPGPIYFLLIPAAITSNPIAGVMVISLFSTVAVAITYIFTTRYYGRTAAIIAALLYTTATTPLWYARFLWQPNLMSPFVILFMFALFQGVVERRKGWLFPALVLQGILFQTHGTTLALLVPLVLAILFAPETIRWRDIAYAITGLAIIFFPFILWHIETRFSDLHIILTQTKQKAAIDTTVYQLYRYMLSPHDQSDPLMAANSYVRELLPYTSKFSSLVFLLVVCGLLLAMSIAIYQWVKKIRTWRQTGSAEKEGRGIWMRITPTPKGAGLLLLCAWQLAPILAMIRHSSLLFPHYLLVVMPGPFILAGYFLSKLCTRIRASYLPLRPILLYGLYGLASLIVIAQLAGSVASIRDMDHGNFSDILANGVRYNDLHSLQQVLHDADQLAEQRHLKRIFIGADFSTENMMYYFGEHMQHQTTVFSTENCLLLPSQTDGPAILILPPSNPIDTKLAEKTGARLLQSSSRLSGAPFKIYEIYPSATQLSSPENTLAQSIQLLPQGSVDRLGDHQTSWLTSKWIILRNHPSSYNMTYSYRFNVMLNHRATSTLDSTCTFSTAHAGDQILAVSMLSKQDTPPLFATVKAFSYNETPDTPMFGIFHLESHRRLLSQISNLQTSTGKRELTLKLK